MRGATKAGLAPAPAPLPENMRWLQLAAGCFAGIALLKFGNPALLAHLVPAPVNLSEFLVMAWPMSWAYFFLAGLAVLAFTTGWAVKGWKGPPLFLGIWLGWQFLAAPKSIDADLTRTTVIYFATVGVMFALGWLVLSKRELGPWFWSPLAICFGWMLWLGLEQHYGGLEATRRAVYADPNWREMPAEFLRKIATNRIFATLFYPNALAAAIAIFAPVVLCQVWEMGKSWPRVARLLAVTLLLWGSIACLYWTESRGGWLVAIAVVAILFLQLPLARRFKLWVAAGILVLGLAGFFVRYSGYFQRGATSATARLQYWSAGSRIFQANPIFGSGPGTFGPAYKKFKTPEAEMTRLAHNDFLQQFTDSGLIGGIGYAGFVVSLVFWLYRKRESISLPERLLWTGFMAFSMHSFLEFNLYLPGISWPVFLLAGYVYGRTLQSEH